ncbi:murein biosynthesis integral membrane protein MurJ [Pseudonocardia endophytica]|uniref:Putative peptidoglycan lipid II flippase n=1 Tax=Pseudonocardia endophytica TaxID=401976 RepID=A0A4R1HLH5_PSEEN|nr:murein biosynthesis integral membrane protein MurJ [Pseudonocardia endophytica]TCK20459.1 putative peptidoglycan lipid II flippase [Pseudonocardia endophytica]
MRDERRPAVSPAPPVHGGPVGRGPVPPESAEEMTRPIPNPVRPSTETTAPIEPVVDAGPSGASGGEQAGSLVRSSSLIAIASLVSRLTGFLRNLAIVAVLGLAVVNDSYTVSNTLPNIVYELLLGGVLTSVMIPVLVRAQQDDTDGGEAFTRRLLTVVGAGLLVATLIAMVAAPLLTRLYLGSGDSGQADPALATAFAWLLLPQIFFYGMGALLGAVLNSKQVFGPFAWAPVLNNVVMLLVLGVYVLVPGEISTDPVRMGDPKLLVLGLGTTIGIVVQAVVLLPSMRRIGFRYRPLWGWDPRLSTAGGMALWIVGYVLAGQAGYIVTTRVAAGADAGSVSTYSNAWLLLQVPYGVIGVSLLTALMPRMSRAAAQGDTNQVVTDLSLGARLSTVGLLPIAALLTVFGTELGVALFSLGAGSGSGASRLGATVAASAFGLLAYAVTMLQLRVFYAMTDSRTPTLIQVGMIVVKIPLLLLCPVLLEPEQVVLGLAAANGLSFVVGVLIGQWLLYQRLGHIRTREVVVTLGKTLVASVVGAAAAWGVGRGLDAAWLADWPAVGRAWTLLVIGTLVALPVTLLGMRVLRVNELDAVFRRFSRR